MSTTGGARAKFHFQVLSTPTVDTRGTSLVLHFDNKRYLFGSVSEGTQRVCIQRGVGVRKLRDIFISGTGSWHDLGGLCGLILSIADSQASGDADIEPFEKPRLSVNGGPLLMHTLACGRKFIFRTGVPLHVREFSPNREEGAEAPTWNDENVKVWALLACPDAKQSIGQADGSDSDYESSDPNSPPSSPGHGRKRSRGEFEEAESYQARHVLDPTDQAARSSIISDMFNSDWSRDALIETTLAEVQQPAAIFIRDPISRGLVPFSSSLTSRTPAEQKVFVRKPWPAAITAEVPAVPENFPRPSISYIVRGHPQRGRFDPKKAKELGVPPGPLFKQLTEGVPVQLENGTVVKPEMVLGPTKPGRGIAIIDLPKRSYVNDLFSRPEWNSNTIMGGVEAIVWLLGRGLLEDPRVQSFMNSLPKVKHIVSSVDICPNYLALDSVAASSIRLSQISRDHFPILVHDNKKIPQQHRFKGEPEKHSSRYNLGRPNFIIPAERGLKVHVEPTFEVRRDEVVPWLNTAKVIDEIPKTVHDLASTGREKFARSKEDDARQMQKNCSSGSASEPEIITLGTGSAAPSKYRNVSATLLRIPGLGNYLFDCGENTLGQLSRVFDNKELTMVLRDLKLIWVSHLHADHHLGLMGILHGWHAAMGPDGIGERNRCEVSVASHRGLMDFLNDYKPLQNMKNVKQIICDSSTTGIDAANPFDWAKGRLGIKDLRTTLVKHCYGAQAVSVTFENGFKFSYSGDCRPSAEFAKIGMNSDVLVHEATFDDGLEGDAMAKKHCTTGEALAVATLMQAKNVILTHFSQRYQKIPVLQNVRSLNQVIFEDEEDLAASEGPIDAFADVGGMPTVSFKDHEAGVNAPNGNIGASVAPSSQPGDPTALSHDPKTPAGGHLHVCVAFDYMRVRVSDIAHMHHFTPALAAVFETEHPEIASTPMKEKHDKTPKSNPGQRHEVNGYGFKPSQMAKAKNKTRSRGNNRSLGEGKANSGARLRAEWEDNEQQADEEPGPLQAVG